MTPCDGSEREEQLHSALVLYRSCATPEQLTLRLLTTPSTRMAEGATLRDA